MLKGSALIRSHFNVDPDSLATEEWARLFNEAVFIERFRQKNQFEMLKAMFNTNKGRGK